jgi:uncharacterized protein
MQMDSKKYALITGASSGIGEAIAREYSRRGKPLVLIARRVDRLEALAQELSKNADCRILAIDLAQQSAATTIFAYTRSENIQVDTLVNNAGYGVPGRYLSPGWKTHADFLQVMIHAVAELTYLYLPEMEKAGHGRILNVASLAGLVPSSAGHTLYGATKAWLIRFSECLAFESKAKGIHVTALCPGFTYSEFHDVNGMRASISKLPKFIWLNSEQVARLGVDAVESGKIKIITGRSNRMIALLSKYTPDFLLRAMVAKQTKQFRNVE